MLLALCWSFPSVKTSSVARAYRLPVRGVDGAGDGGRLCPSISTFGNAFFSVLAAPPGAGVLPLTEEDEEFDSDIALCRRVGRASRGQRTCWREGIYFRIPRSLSMRYLFVEFIKKRLD